MLKKYGRFSQDGCEFIITTPLTPRPWINYLTNGRYCAIISHCAGGYSFYQDCRTDRITRWLPENWHFDRPGRYIYAKETDCLLQITNPKRNKNDKRLAISNKQRVWSVTYQPLRVKPDFYQARHGLGYTTIETKYYGIHSQVSYFVPQADDCEVWLVSIENQTSKPRTLEVYPYIEWLLGDYHQELRYRNIMNLYNRLWFDRRRQIIFAKKTAFWENMNIRPFKYLAFFACSLPVKDCWVRKDEFLGRYNTEERPQAITESRGPKTESRICSGEDGIAAFRHTLRLKPKENREFTIVMGQLEGISNIKRIVDKYRNIEKAKRELQKTRNFWRRRILDNIIIKTPDKNFNLMMNIWVKYQLYICNLWSRSPSYYHEGSGGRGYRDSAQDAESIMALDPQLARRKILKLASLIRQDGTCAPGWSDTQGPAQHRPNKDHQVWLTFTVCAYVKETADISILKESIPFLKDKWKGGWCIDEKFKGAPTIEGEGTLFEHLEKNLEFAFNDVGSRGLPLIGHADWNDAIDAAGIKLKGESIWLAEALVRALTELAALAGYLRKPEKAQELLDKAAVMARRINKVGWDGAWYVRGFTDAGQVYGSKDNPEGKIYLNTQSWAILAEVAGEEKREKIVKSVNRYLNGPHGLALFFPAYSRYYPELGRISMFSQGTKENAAVFAHAATFMIVALAKVGEGNFAYEAIKKLMPNEQKNYDLYKTEPYVFTEYLVGPQHPYLYGEGAFTWITGSAGWSFMAACEWILGARRDFKGLRVDPCLPSHWRRCFIRRPFRNTVYDIEIENPKGVQKGVKEVWVDGQRLEDNLIRPHSDGKIHQVKVIMG
jgi:cellobiose phosphorylase